jgi:hypothetical protein
MPKTMTLNVRVSGALGEFVAANVGDDGAYETMSAAMSGISSIGSCWLMAMRTA